MAEKSNLSPIALALGAAFATSLSGVSTANAADNPFAMNSLSSGYMVAEKMEGKCGEGKCGAGRKGMMMMDANSDGNVTHQEFMDHHEKLFTLKDKNGDGSISADEMMMPMEGKGMEGKCGEGMMKKDMEGKCGGNQ